VIPRQGYVTTWRCRACGQAGEALSPFSLTNPTGPKPEAVGRPLVL